MVKILLDCYLYQLSISSLKAKNVVKFCVHISPIFSCRVTYIYIYIYICISYNMGKRDLPDIYALARGPQAPGHGIYIRQIPIAHVISDIYHLSIYHVR